jgi:hypothetical protein
MQFGTSITKNICLSVFFFLVDNSGKKYAYNKINFCVILPISHMHCHVKRTVDITTERKKNRKISSTSMNYLNLIVVNT